MCNGFRDFKLFFKSNSKNISKMGKIKVQWDADWSDMNENQLKHKKLFVDNIDLDVEGGSWVMVSLSESMEKVVKELNMKKGLWDLLMLVVIILFMAWIVICIYDYLNGKYEFIYLSLLIGLSVFLVLVTWLHWFRNVKIIKKKIYGIVWGGVCTEVFIFGRSLDDESIKSRADVSDSYLRTCNETYKQDWFDVNYIVPKSFENWEQYIERVKEIVFTCVRKKDKVFIENDLPTFLGVNLGQIEDMGENILID